LEMGGKVVGRLSEWDEEGGTQIWGG